MAKAVMQIAPRALEIAGEEMSISAAPTLAVRAKQKPLGDVSTMRASSCRSRC